MQKILTPLPAPRGRYDGRIDGTTATGAANTTGFAAGIRPLGAERIVINGLR
jgi:hypothetical protein